ncbi:MAG: 50S ribosomal protein L4 [Clostridiales bacterium]|nr:50S ribosomal protein L4 [Clostridiales bacterium]
MSSIDVLDMQGKKVSTLELNDAIFNKEVNEALIHTVIVNYLANQRQGTQSTKTRSEVSGGGRKPWRQKGTGRARHGSTRSPIWVKGGIALGPKPRSYKYKLNKKEKQNAIKMILSAKLADNKIIVLNELNLTEVKTKAVVNVMRNVNAEGRTLLLLPERNETIFKSARNIDKMHISNVDVLNAYELLNNKQIVMTVDAVKKLEEVYA